LNRSTCGMNRLIINPEKSALINVPIPIAPSKKKASVTKTMLISAREYIKSLPVNFETTSIVPSSGFGAIDDCKYKADLRQVKKNASVTKTMLISAREYIKSLPFNFETTSIVPSSGFGAIDDCKYKAVPRHVKKRPNP